MARSPADLWRAIYHLGTSHESTNPEARQIRMLNASLSIATVSILIYPILYLLQDAKRLLPLTIITLAFVPWFLLGFSYSAKGRYKPARLILNSGIVTLACVAIIATGRETGFQYFLLLFSLVPVLVWGKDEWPLFLAFFMLNVGSFILFQFFWPFEPVLPLEPGWVPYLRATFVFVIFFSIVLLVIVMQYEAARRERQLQGLVDTKNLFLRLIAHDLKNPLTGFIGILEQLADPNYGLNESERREYTGMLLHSARSLRELLENLLTWAQDQQGQIPFQPRVQDLGGIVEDALETLRSLAAAKGLRMSADLSSQVSVSCDRSMIHTVARNLVANAIKFTPSGGRVDVSIRQNGTRSVLEVKDSGIGMDAELAARLFKPGLKVRRKGTNGEDGTGLGLILCDAFARRHGAQLEVESTPRAGSTFRVVFSTDPAA